MLFLQHPQQTLLEKISWFALRVAMFFGVVSLFLEYGFFISEQTGNILHIVNVGVVTIFILHVLLNWLFARNKKIYFKSYWLEITLVALFFLQLGATYFAAPVLLRKIFEGLHITRMTGVYIVLIQIYIVFHLILGFARFNARIASLAIKPATILLFSYLFLVILGTVFLLLPKASASNEHPITSLDALFTATSATCVTGLTIRDTGNDFSTTGQMMILFLIQLGGLGLVTFTMFFSLLQQRFLGVRQTVILRDILNYDIIGQLGKFLAYVFIITFLIEIVGAVLLYQLWNEPGMDYDGRLKWSIFHSVSAFCNAGFSLKSTNFMSYANNLLFNSTIISLIVLGGLGFPVIMNLLQFRISTLPFFRRLRWLKSRRDTEDISRLSIQIKIVLFVTIILIVGGALLFFGLEYHNTLQGKPLPQKITSSIFQSVTARTAGFNTVNINDLKPPTLILLIGLMIIGASPLSTGGGIKTVTFIVLLATVYSMMHHRERVEMIKRTIPKIVVHTAVSITVLYAICAFSFSFLLMITDPQVAYKNALFETISALSTVGLSTGITFGLSAGGKMLLCVMMFIGRTGPLMILLSIIHRTTQANYQYPEENLILT
ncbi:MAG: potassium transporter TrkG [Planctomycetota bacterium]